MRLASAMTATRWGRGDRSRSSQTLPRGARRRQRRHPTAKRSRTSTPASSPAQSATTSRTSSRCAPTSSPHSCSRPRDRARACRATGEGGEVPSSSTRSRSAPWRSPPRRRHRTPVAPMRRRIGCSSRSCAPDPARPPWKPSRWPRSPAGATSSPRRGSHPAPSPNACRPCDAWPRRSAPTPSSRRCAAPTSNTNAPAPSPTASSPACSRAPTCARRSASATARSSS